MKKPRLLNLSAGVSLLLAIAIIAFWVRSSARDEAIVRVWHTSTERRVWKTESLYSALQFTSTRAFDTGPPIAPSYEYVDVTPPRSMNPRPRHWFPFPPVGFQHLVGSSIPGSHLRRLTLTYWLLLPPTLVLPAVAIARHRRRRHRETNNLCPTCGYDLRATPDRCPECGTASECKLQISSSKLDSTELAEV